MGKLAFGILPFASPSPPPNTTMSHYLLRALAVTLQGVVYALYGWLALFTLVGLLLFVSLDLHGLIVALLTF